MVEGGKEREKGQCWLWRTEKKVVVSGVVGSGGNVMGHGSGNQQERELGEKNIVSY